MFEIIDRDGLARIGKFSVGKKSVETPALMPVINPNIIVISPREIYEKFRTHALITNSYIIYRDLDLKEKALKDGLHKLLDFPGIIMTDSGTFQDHVYGDINIDFLEIAKFQKDIGSDIITILDIFTEPEFDRERVENAIEETYKRAKLTKENLGNVYIAGPIQGGIYPDLREKAAIMMNSLDLDYYPIGGVVPLMENYRYRDLVNIIMSVKMNIDYGKPVHLFGAGHPMFFAFAVLMGIDFFDSASYVKYARDDRILFPDGTRYLDDLKYVPYPSPYLDRYDLDDIKSMEKEEREKILAMHNLYISMEEIERVKAAIFENSLWEYVEERARSHPSLYDALIEIYKYSEKIDKFENLSKKHPFYYTGKESLMRPLVKAFEKRIIKNYKYNKKICFVLESKDLKEYSKLIENVDAHFLIRTPMGFVPYNLLHVYPIYSAIFPENCEYYDNLNRILESIDFDVLVSLINKKLDEKMEKLLNLEFKRKDMDIERIRNVIDFQFGYGAGDALLDGNVKIVKSKNTGMIRNIYLNDQHILSMRNDGLFTLKLYGGKILHRKFNYPKLRTVVTKESEEFNLKGKNVFARFIVDMDPDLRPFDETIIVNESDQFIGVGRTLFTRDEALKIKKGMVVELREFVKRE